jgi:signal peptidase II
MFIEIVAPYFSRAHLWATENILGSGLSYKHFAATRLPWQAAKTMKYSNKSRIAWRMGYLVASLGLYLMDQASKAWAVRRLRFEDRTIVNGILDLVYAENRGIAFGQLQDGGAFGRWFFVTLASLAAIAVLFYFFRTTRNDDRILGACALLLAGILGNLTDRVRLGFVIDFIMLHAGQYHWPTFNVADASISMGALFLAYDLIFAGKESEHDRREKQPLITDN